MKGQFCVNGILLAFWTTLLNCWFFGHAFVAFSTGFKCWIWKILGMTTLRLFWLMNLTAIKLITHFESISIDEIIMGLLQKKAIILFLTLITLNKITLSLQLIHNRRKPPYILFFIFFQLTITPNILTKRKLLTFLTLPFTINFLQLIERVTVQFIIIVINNRILQRVVLKLILWCLLTLLC